MSRCSLSPMRGAKLTTTSRRQSAWTITTISLLLCCHLAQSIPILSPAPQPTTTGQNEIYEAKGKGEEGRFFEGDIRLKPDDEWPYKSIESAVKTTKGRLQKRMESIMESSGDPARDLAEHTCSWKVESIQFKFPTTLLLLLLGGTNRPTIISFTASSSIIGGTASASIIDGTTSASIINIGDTNNTSIIAIGGTVSIIVVITLIVTIIIIFIIRLRRHNIEDYVGDYDPDHIYDVVDPPPPLPPRNQRGTPIALLHNPAYHSKPATQREIVHGENKDTDENYDSEAFEHQHGRLNVEEHDHQGNNASAYTHVHLIQNDVTREFAESNNTSSVIVNQDTVPPSNPLPAGALRLVKEQRSNDQSNASHTMAQLALTNFEGGSPEHRDQYDQIQSYELIGGYETVQGYERVPPCSVTEFINTQSRVMDTEHTCADQSDC